jgi:hypothetical protein
MQNRKRNSTINVETEVQAVGSVDSGVFHPSGSCFTAVLETTWSRLREIIPGLPQVIMLVLSAREHRRRGHFVGDAWLKRRQRDLLHEVAVHPGMFGSPADLLNTILHEAAHAILWDNRKEGDRHCGGVSLHGYYHRREFRKMAEQLGLKVHFLNRRYGHCVTTWPAAGVPAQYESVLHTLEQFTVVASESLPQVVVPEPPKKQSPWLVAGCACSPQRLLRCPRGEMQRGGIECRVCGELFLA